MRNIIGLLFVFISLNVVGQHQCSQTKINSFNSLQNAQKNSRDLSEYANYDVHHVSMDLAITNTSTYISGVVTTTVEVVTPLMNRIVFELHEDLTVNGATINGVAVTGIDRVDTELILSLPTFANQGEMLEIAVDYEGTPPSGSGFFSDAGIFNAFSPSWGAQVTWTLSQPFGAYTWWPCKQSLTDKIDSTEMILTVPTGTKGGSNGVLMSETTLPNGDGRFVWRSKHPIDFYLISLAVGPYIEYSYKVKPVTSPDSILIQNYIYDNPMTLQNFQADIDETGDMMNFFSQIYGNYPFWDEKYGHCMAPLSGGMEHQTMTTQGFFNRSLTAHELGHQWFGDHVTCADWAHIWVNEGFATYSSYLFEESIDYASAQGDMAFIHNDVMQFPGGSVYVDDIEDAGRIFSSRLTYNKGAAIIHNMRYWMTDQFFFEALRAYQTQFSNGTATAEDFQAVLEFFSSEDFTNFFQHWYYGEGFPTYSANWNQDSDGLVIELSQQSSMASVTPFFENYIEVGVSFTDATDTTLRLYNIANGQHFLRAIDKQIATITIDPNNWMINEVDVIQKDVNLAYNPLLSSINELSTEVSIFPNPVENVLHISADGSSEIDVIIYNMAGQEIARGSTESKLSFDATNWTKGVYLVQISDGVGVQTTKVVH